MTDDQAPEPIDELTPADDDFNYRVGTSLRGLSDKITANHAAIGERIVNLGRICEVVFQFFREEGSLDKLPHWVAETFGWNLKHFHALRRAAELFSPDEVATITPDALLALSAADVPDAVIEDSKLLCRHRVVTRLHVHRLIINRRNQDARRRAGRLHEDERPLPVDFDARNPRNRRL